MKAWQYIHLEEQKRGAMNEAIKKMRAFLACSGIRLRYFDQNMQPLSATPPKAKVQSDFAVLSDSDDNADMEQLLWLTGVDQSILRFCQENVFPGFATDQLSLVYLAVADRDETDVRGVYVIGPVFMTEHATEECRKVLQPLRLSVQKMHRILKVLQEIPVVPHSILIQYGRILYQSLYGVYPSFAEIKPIIPDNDMDRRLSAVPESRENTVLKEQNYSYILEQKMLKAVENGNLSNTDPEEMLRMNWGTMSHKDSLRNAQDQAVALLTLVSRAAIRGGLPEKMAYTLCNYYIRLAEDSESIDYIYQYVREAFRDFTRRVQRYQKHTKEVQICMSYLEMHIDRKVSMQELAKVTGLNANYLSGRFSREMGISINAFTMNLKMEQAGIFLQNTEESLQEICNRVGISSTSYFCCLFKKKMGVTPMEYRNGKRNRNRT